MSTPPKPSPPGNLISLTIRDISQLYASYVPFVQNGALFVPISKKFQLGEEVLILLTLMQETEKLPVSGKIVWINPIGEMHNRAAGIGVQFSDADSIARQKIEQYLSGNINLDRPTHTL